MGRPPPDHSRTAAIESHANLAGYKSLRASDVRRQVLVVRREPEAVVYKLCVLAADLRLEAQRVLCEDQRLERAVGLVEENGRGRFIDLARLDAHEPIFDHVDPPDAVLARGDIQRL